MTLRKLGYLVVSFVLFAVSVMPVSVAAIQSPSLIITQIKTGGKIEGQPTEFVEIYNPTESVANLDGLVLEYAKPSANLNICSTLDWGTQDSSSAVKTSELAGQLAAYSFAVVEMSMNDNAGGSVRLRSDSAVVDLVGWGNTLSFGACKEGDVAPMPEKGTSIKRYTDSKNTFIDSDDNKADFADSQIALDGIYPLKESVDADVCSNLEGNQAVVPDGFAAENNECHEQKQDVKDTCEHVSISEIVPNPGGSDTGNEYIELYNSSKEPVTLEGCSLKVGSSTKELTGQIEPGYMAVYGLVLPNAAGGTVELFTVQREEVVEYPADLGDDEAWALIDGTWQRTTQATPGEANLLAAAAVAGSSDDTLGPCPVGKYRNPTTNRCKTIETSSGLKPCASDQFRNPETNRCKSKATAVTSLKPCGPGQTRNPETNRCKKTSSSESNLKPCDEGEERNPETNRCRKVAGVSTNTPSEDPENTSNINYVLIGLFAFTAVLYGVYEYRTSIANSFVRLKQRISK